MIHSIYNSLSLSYYWFIFVLGMAGLAVTYGLQLNARLSRWILSFCKLENKIISIERIHQYCHIPSEAPPIIEESRPPPSWPEEGKIEIIDLKVSITIFLRPVLLQLINYQLLIIQNYKITFKNSKIHNQILP